MEARKTPYRLLTAFVVTLLVVLALSLACAAPEPTPTPIPPAPPAPPVAPTVAPTPVVTAAPTLPTPMPVQPTPTRVLPTATPAVTGKVTYGGTLRYALTRGFDTMDPAYNSERGFRPILFAIFSNLVRLNPNGTVAPELARSWDFSQDGKVVTFHLQTGVKFQDGTSLDAQAVKWNYDRFVDSKVGSVRRAELIPPLERVEVVDSQTIRFYLSEPFRPLMPTLTTRAGQFTSPTAVQKLNSYAERSGDFGRRPVGSGPFKLKEWIPDNRVVIVRNESYWEKGLPYLDAIEHPFIADQQVQFAMLRTGELDVMEEMRGGDVPIARANPSLRVLEGGGARFRMLWIRLSKEPWNNKTLREAFAYAMNRDTLVKVLYDGLATPAYQPIAPIYGVWYDPTYKAFEYNPQKARDKLREAGYPSGFSYVQPCSNSAFDLRWCEVFQVMAADVGIKAEIKPWVAGTYATDFIQRKNDGPLLTGLTPRSDPHLLLQRYFHSRGAGNFPYGVDYTNSEVDRLIDEGAKVYDVAKAKEIYQKASKLIVEDVAYVFYLYEPTLVGIRANVRNFAIHSDLEIRLRDLWLEK